MTKPLLLVQPLKIDDIKINIMNDDEEEEEQEPQAVVDGTMTPIDNIIDDAELLAILGFPTTTPNTPISILENSNSLLLDWEDMPELSESEEDDHFTCNNNKRKHQDEGNDDIFAQFDFEEANLLYQQTTTKKTKIDVVEEQQCLIDPQVGDLIST